MRGKLREKDVNHHKFYDNYLNKFEEKNLQKKIKNGKLSFMINTTKRKAKAQQQHYY